MFSVSESLLAARRPSWALASRCRVRVWMLCVPLLAFVCGAGRAQLPDQISDTSWAQVQRLSGIATQPGLSATALYVFFDPNCPYCARLWTTPLAQGLVADVPAIWVPVAYLNKTSEGKAAALLRSSNKAELAHNFTLFNHTQHQGRSDAVVPSEAEKQSLKQAQALWNKLGGATPMLVWRMRSSRVPVKYIGLPPSELLQQLLGDMAPSDLQGFTGR